MLGPSLKEQGRASYDGFWQGIESVEVQSAEANGNTVDVTLVYTRTNGETSTERKQEGLISDGERRLPARHRRLHRDRSSGALI